MLGNTNSPLPWERQSGEPAKAYAQFCLFRDYPYKNKNNVTVPQIQRNRKLTVFIKDSSETTVKRLSTKYKWFDRAAQYDDYIDEVNRQEQEAEIIKMRRLHAKIARDMIQKAAEKIKSVDIDDISVREAIKMFDIGVHCERLSRGETTENLATEINDKSGMQGMQGLIKSLQAARARSEENK